MCVIPQRVKLNWLSKNALGNFNKLLKKTDRKRKTQGVNDNIRRLLDPCVAQTQYQMAKTHSLINIKNSVLYLLKA